jgi:hypothetical protein
MRIKDVGPCGVGIEYRPLKSTPAPKEVDQQNKAAIAENKITERN